MSATKKQILFPLAAISGGVLLALMIIMTKAGANKRDEEKTVPFVSVETISLDPIQLVAHSQGEVGARYQTRLVSQVSGKVIEVSPSFENGALVKKGDLLVQIDPFDYKVRAQQAKANLASARAAFIQERAQGQVAEAEWAAISNAEPSELGLRKPQQEQALAAVKASEAAYTQALKDLERTKILAPFDGIVKSREVSPGTFVNVGGNVGELLDVSVAEVRLPVNQSDFAILNEAGQSAQVQLFGTVYGQPNVWQAQVVRDEGLVDADSRMIYLIAHIDDPYTIKPEHEGRARLPFGTYVKAEISGKRLEAAVRVPRRLFINGFLPLVKDQRLTLQEVGIVKEEGKFSIVHEGVLEGDLLVVSTLDAPVAGMEVTWEGAPNPLDPQNAESAIASADLQNKKKTAQSGEVK